MVKKMKIKQSKDKIKATIYYCPIHNCYHFGECSVCTDKQKNLEVERCCVCGHPLSSHIDEGNGWRCHSLGGDGYQCECWLRKAHANDKEYYNIEERIKEMSKELKK